MKHSVWLLLPVLICVGCATSRKASSVKTSKAGRKAAAVAKPAESPKAEAAPAPVAASPIAEFFARLAAQKPGTDVKKEDIPFDYFTSPEALVFIGATKSTDLELHRAVALSLPRAADEQRFAAAAALAGLAPTDPEILRAVADVLEQAMLDRGFDKDPARLKYARDLLSVLARRPEPDASIEALALELIDDGSQAELQQDALEILKTWNALTEGTQLTLLSRARDTRYTAETRSDLFALLKRLEKPDDDLVLAALDVFQKDENSVAREEALSLLVTWRPSDQAIVARLNEAGIETSSGAGRAPASTGN